MERNMEWGELLVALGRFGFTERESRLYLMLLRRGAARVSDLTRELHVDRVHSYRLLDGMRARGLVQATSERPRRYVALPPQMLVERSLFERRRALEEDVTLAAELVRRLPELSARAEAGIPRFQVMTGAPSIYPFLRHLVQESRERLDVMITPRAVRDSTRFGVPRELPRFLRAGGKIRMLLEAGAGLEPFLRRLESARRRFGEVEARTLPQQRARLTIADGREAIVFLVPESDRATVEETAVWTDNSDFVRAQQAHFDALWTVGAPVRGGRRAPSDRESRPTRRTPRRPPSARRPTPHPRTGRSGEELEPSGSV